MDVWDDSIIDEELAADVKEANSILQEGLEAAKDFAVDAKIVKKVAKDIKDLYRPTMKLKEGFTKLSWIHIKAEMIYAPI